jgi:hypothetical protein
MFKRPDNWDELSVEERRELRFDSWTSTEEIEFVSDETKEKYERRIGLFRDAVKMREPARVPISLGAGNFALTRAGLGGKELHYEPEKIRDALLDYHETFDPDTATMAFPTSGEGLETIGFELYRWGGHQLPDDDFIQMVEGEYLKADEYPEYLLDPTSWYLHKYFPRIATELEPLKKLGAISTATEINQFQSLLIPFAFPDVQEALKALMEAGEKTMAYYGKIGAIGAQLKAMGYPGMMGSYTKVPFDALGDTLRGTRGIMTDIYRNKDEVKAACKQLVPLMIRAGVSGCDRSGGAFAMMPLHKGADSFMSEEQYAEFYWPTFKEVMLGMIEEGIVPFLFAEGSYDQRLDFISELPKGATVWYFDQTDMARAKRVLGDKCCIQGNLPVSLLATGTPERVREACKELIDACAPGGGYILANGCGLDHGKDENVKAMLDFSREYGVYK